MCYWIENKFGESLEAAKHPHLIDKAVHQKECNLKALQNVSEIWLIGF